MVDNVQEGSPAPDQPAAGENASTNASAAAANEANKNETNKNEKSKNEKKAKNTTADSPEGVKEEIVKGENLFDPGDLGVLNEVSISLTIEIGRAQIKIRDLLNLTKGSIIELNKLAGDPVDIYANGKLISTGNIITANGKYCVRVTSISDKNKLGVEADGK